MTTTLCGTREILDGDCNDLSVIYRYLDLPDVCHHGLLVYARKMDTIGRPSIYETCIYCGNQSSSRLKTSHHPDWISYPIIDQNYKGFDDYNYRRGVFSRFVDPTITVCSDSGGDLIPLGRLWEWRDIYYGGRCSDSWNQVLDKIDNRHIPRRRARALQFGLQKIHYHDRIIHIDLAVDFDPRPYESIITSAISKLIPTDSIIIGTESAYSWTAFGGNFFYSDFLASIQWKQTKYLALEWLPNRRSLSAGRAVCEMPHCSGNSRKIDCHHLTYLRAGHEKPGDLIFLCSECHENIEYVNSLIPKEYCAALIETTTDAA